eukprot:189584_1
MAEEKVQETKGHNFNYKDLPKHFGKGSRERISAIESANNEKQKIEEKQNEKILSVKKNKKIGDRRKIANEKGLANIVRLTMELNDGEYVGTGTIYYIDTAKRVAWVITCAHNIVDIDPTNNKPYYALNVWIDKKETDPKNNKSKSICHVKVSVGFVHPEYFENPISSSGYDLALLTCKLSQNDIRILCDDKYIMPVIAATPFDVNRLYLYGYPGDKYGLFCGMEGSCKGTGTLFDDGGYNHWYEFADGGQVITYSDVDTNGGQSGSPIIYKNDIHYHILIGVHTGGSTFKGKNWGTEIHGDHLGWIGTTMGLDVDEDIPSNNIGDEWIVLYEDQLDAF